MCRAARSTAASGARRRGGLRPNGGQKNKTRPDVGLAVFFSPNMGRDAFLRAFLPSRSKCTKFAPPRHDNFPIWNRLNKLQPRREEVETVAERPGRLPDLPLRRGPTGVQVASMVWTPGGAAASPVHPAGPPGPARFAAGRLSW